MKALDTNVLVRVLTYDDADQAETAAAEMRAGQLFLAATVLLETEWVLRHAYGFGREAVGAALQGVVDLGNAVVEHEARVRDALRWYAHDMDFADALHLAAAQDCEELITFDQRLGAVRAQVGEGTPIRLLT